MSLLPLPDNDLDNDPFDFAGSVGRNADNNRDDVIKAQMLLASAGEFDLPAPGMPTGWPGEGLTRAIRNVQKASGLPVDGLMLPLQNGAVGANGEGETLSALKDLLDGRVREQAIPTVQQVDRFYDRYAQASPDGVESVATDAGKATPARPTLNKSADRIRSILNDEPARFDIADNPDEDGSAPLWRSHEKGVKAVRDYGHIVEREAKRLGVDPDLVKAILYYENADGHKLILNDLGDWLGASDTVMPMNINPKIWGKLGIPTREDARNPERNIQAATLLLKRIVDRLDNPTPAKVGAIWNGIGHEKVNHRGARIGRIYQERSWEKP
jgi:hypothetical protein